MRYFTTMMLTVAILFIASSCGDKEEKACDAGETTTDVTKKEKEDKNYLCYVGCLEAEKSSLDCKKECYGVKKGKKDVVDSPDDVTATKADAVSAPADVSGTNG